MLIPKNYSLELFLRIIPRIIPKIFFCSKELFLFLRIIYVDFNL